MRHLNILTFITLFTLVLTGLPSPCHAFQSHPAPEGLYVHQMSHVLFIGALAYLYWHLGKSSLIASRGWHYMRLFCLLFLVWNCLTFAGHASYSYLSVDDFVNMGTWQSKIALPVTPLKLLYYLTRFEHLISVPAIFCLFIGLRLFYREVCAEEEK